MPPQIDRDSRPIIVVAEIDENSSIYFCLISLVDEESFSLNIVKVHITIFFKKFRPVSFDISCFLLNYASSDQEEFLLV